MNWSALLQALAGAVAAGIVAAGPVLAAGGTWQQALAAFVGAAFGGGVLHQLNPPGTKPPLPA
jgi:hypothetical protein